MNITPRPLRCLAVAPNWVGDTVMALPVLEALAASGRQVSVLAPSHLHPLLEISPAVEAAIVKRASSRETARDLRGHEFDEAVLLPNSFSAAWLVYRAQIPKRVGYRGDLRSLLLNPALHRPFVKAHQLHDYDRLLRAMGVALSETPPRLSIPTVLDEQVITTLEQAGVEPQRTGSPLVGLFAGAEFGPSKRWPLTRFASAAQRLSRLPSGPRPLLLAGPSEVALAERLQRESGDQYPVVGPNLNLAQLAALLARLDVLITNDSGPMHLAAAVETPCIAIFGPTDPQRTAPCGSGHHVLSSARWCAPCFRRRCPLLHHRCMTEIQVDHVIAAAAKVLQ